jgi:hypothetical protein
VKSGLYRLTGDLWNHCSLRNQALLLKSSITIWVRELGVA